MSRPTNQAVFEEAEQWMLHSFGTGMGDYLASKRRDPLSVSLSEIDRVMKASGVRKMLTQWRQEDVLSDAGRKSYIDASGALGLLLLQVRLRRPLLLTEISETVLEMSPRQRMVLGITHDGRDSRVYERVWNAVQRLIGLVDEFPGRRDKILDRDEYRAVVFARDVEQCAIRRERMALLSNALVEGTWKLLPENLRSKSHGNMAQDATLVPVLGKHGNPTARNLEENRRSVNYDAGYYGRNGAHGAMTHSDARVLNKQNPGADHKGTSKRKSTWGVEAEICRLLPDIDAQTKEFPLLTIGVGFHIPGTITGEGHRMVESLRERDHKLNYVVVDRAYPGGKAFEFQVAVRKLGAKLVFDYKDKELEGQQYHPSGFIQVAGAWYLDILPKVLRGAADLGFRAAKNERDAAVIRAKKANDLTNTLRTKARTHADNKFKMAQNLYDKQVAERAKYMLKNKGHMSPDGTRRYLIPLDAPRYSAWKAKAGAHQGVTVAMKLPTTPEPNDTDKNPGGLKHEQHLQFGSPEWRTAYGKRNIVESANRNLKRSQFENLADPDRRHVRGNTFTYLAIAASVVVENLRTLISFYKTKLALTPVTPKNDRLAETFWQRPDEPATVPKPPW
jgi:hypothetical protein